MFNLLNSYYKYPQYLWAKKILNLLHNNVIGDIQNCHFYDIPGGNGIISYWLTKNNPKIKCTVMDLDDNALKIASNKGLNVSKEDIYQFKTKNPENIWLFINSLYCLPEASGLLNNMNKYMHYVIAVFPYIEEKNYTNYLINNPGYPRDCEMNKDDTIKYFSENGFELKYESDITRIPFLAHEMPYFIKKIINKLYNILDFIFYWKKSYYWIAVFKNSNK